MIVTRGAALQDHMARVIEDYLRQAQIADEAPLLRLGMKERTARQRQSVQRAMGAGMDFPQSFSRFFAADKFGMATTHWKKLEDRVQRGVGNPCPLLLIGLPRDAITPYSAATPEL